MSGTIVGTSTFVFPMWKGQIIPRTPQLDVYRRLGGTTDSSETLGSQGPESPIEAHFLTTTDSAAIAFRASVMQLAGQYCDITEPDACSWTNALVKSCIARKRAGPYNFGGVSYPRWVQVSLVIIAQQ